MERRLQKEVKRRGGQCLKWVSPGFTGVPDRLVFLPWNVFYLVELKSENGRLSPRQKLVGRQLAEIGFPVHVIANAEQFENFIKLIDRESI